MSTTLDSRYDPNEAQQRWYDFWERRGYFHAEPDERQPYTIVIPPPNVTGALHMGHALNNTLQDVLIRWRRMQGFNTLWVPGTDHAGIGTQAVVERRLREQEKKTRHDLGRDGLVQRIWAWKDDYEARILNQLRRLGSSCDWQRTRFTLDPVCARAVRQTFFRMFQDALIYRGKRLVNWDTHLQTAVADDEIFHETVQGHLWTFRYPVKAAGEPAGQAGEHIRIATTRPETRLGDTAVAVHPADPRYQHLIGRTVELPLTGREIPIIADAILVDPKFGTGCVKVTPAHDPNDYQTGLRHRLPMINILNPDGTIHANGGKYAGMDRDAAREAVVADLQALGLVESVEDYETQVGHSDRSKTPIEPYLSDQWFVRMDKLAEAAMDAVRDGRVRIHPERYTKTYLDWLGEKRDWCISRQLWWGHRIPVWRQPVSHDAPAQAAALRALETQPGAAPEDSIAWQINRQGTGEIVHSSHEEPSLFADLAEGDYDILVCMLRDDAALVASLEAAGFVQDRDVLDTWFSSALWPHSTLGWPEPTPDLEYYYPTSTLVTSRDIITLWVARMVITGLYNCGDVPFRDVYIHPKILDAFGQTMSKSKGNGVDPLDIIDRYGADALRFTLTRMTTETQDVRMPVGYACPHCGTIIAQKSEHQQMKPRDGRKPRIKCPSCKKEFQFSSPNFDPDAGEPVGRVVSERFEEGRNFANKLWNAARFALLNLENYTPGPVALDQLADEERWILSRLAGTVSEVTEHLERFRFSAAANAIYDFAWSEFCDWYVEMAKLRLRDPATRGPAQRVLATVLDHLIRLLQPVMPFLAEQVWQALGAHAPERGIPIPSAPADSVMIAPWPLAPTEWRDPQVERRIARLQEVIKAIRNIRSKFSVEPKRRVTAVLRTSADIAAELRGFAPFIAQLATVSDLRVGPDEGKPADSVSAVSSDWELWVPLAGLIDRPAEIARNRKLLGSIEGQLKSFRSKLGSAEFVSKAPPDVVELHRQREADLLNQKASLQEILHELEGVPG